jgi:hypothetical protein
MKLSEKHLLIVLILLFAFSSVFLFWKNTTELDPDHGKNWWTLSFTEPQNTSNLNFTLTNHSDAERFHYQVLSGREVISEQDIEINKGETRQITIDTPATDDDRMSIRVFQGTEKKEIYR